MKRAQVDSLFDVVALLSSVQDTLHGDDELGHAQRLTKLAEKRVRDVIAALNV